MKKRIIGGAAGTVIITIVAVVLVLVIGKSPYASHFVTTSCVRTNTSKKASLSFGSLKGNMVFKLRCDGKEGRELVCTGELGDGTATVYYDYNGTKMKLFTIQGGEKIKVDVKKLEKGKVYVIVESDGKCKDGKFTFKIR